MIVCLIFRTAIIINRKNLIVTIKLHFENLSIFFKGVLVSLFHCSFLFAFQGSPTSPPKQRYFLNVPKCGLFYRYCFARCSSELAQLVPLPFSKWRSTHYSDRLHDFYVTISISISAAKISKI